VPSLPDERPPPPISNIDFQSLIFKLLVSLFLLTSLSVSASTHRFPTSFFSVVQNGVLSLSQVSSSTRAFAERSPSPPLDRPNTRGFLGPHVILILQPLLQCITSHAAPYPFALTRTISRNIVFPNPKPTFSELCFLLFPLVSGQGLTLLPDEVGRSSLFYLDLGTGNARLGFAVFCGLEE